MRIVYQSSRYTLKSYGDGRAYLLTRDDGRDRFWCDTDELEALARSIHAQWHDKGGLTDAWAAQLMENSVR